MRQWFFAPIIAFEPEVGFEAEFDVQCEGQTFSHQWKVTEVRPESRITNGWRYGGYDGDSSVTWELSKTPDGTKLTLSHNGHQSFPQDNPIFSRESGEAGWGYFLHESLKSFLAR